MRFGNIVLLALLLLGGIWIGYFTLVKAMRERAPSSPSAEAIADQGTRRPRGKDLPILWDSPSFSFPDQAGRVITNTDLHGHVWISDFFFTSCTTLCPMMTAKMADTYKAIADSGIELVSFSVDPDHDTPKVLAEYARMWGADESRWHFLSTTKEGLVATAAGMKTFVRPPDEGNQIQHSSIFILTDADGKVRGVYDSLDASALKRLVFDALTLAGKSPPVPSETEVNWPMPDSDRGSDSPGAVLYASRGCAACHSQERVAPPLAHCFGESVMLEDGHTVNIDDAYIRESILDPGAKYVAGYSHMMPSYRGQLTSEETDRLVAFIKGLSAGAPNTSEASTTQPAAPQVVDPVCGMAIPIGKLQAGFKGRVYYFCSDSCRDAFLKSPEKFADQTQNAGKSPTTMQ